MGVVAARRETFLRPTSHVPSLRILSSSSFGNLSVLLPICMTTELAMFLLSHRCARQVLKSVDQGAATQPCELFCDDRAIFFFLSLTSAKRRFIESFELINILVPQFSFFAYQIGMTAKT